MVCMLDIVKDGENLLSKLVVDFFFYNSWGETRSHLIDFLFFADQLRADFLFADDIVDVVFVRNFGQLHNSASVLNIIEGLIPAQNPILNHQFALHLIEAFHIAGKIVLDVLEVVNLKNHNFADCIPKAYFTFGFDFGKLFADLRISHHIVIDAGIIRINGIAEAILLLPILLQHSLFLLIGSAFGDVTHLHCCFFKISLTCVKRPELPLHLNGKMSTLARVSLIDGCRSLSFCWAGRSIDAVKYGIRSSLI